MSAPATPPRDEMTRADDARDIRLAQLAGDLADQLRAGATPDVEAVLRDNADVADEPAGQFPVL